MVDNLLLGNWMLSWAGELTIPTIMFEIASTNDSFGLYIISTMIERMWLNNLRDACTKSGAMTLNLKFFLSDFRTGMN